jgi:SAM-dependent methyltransferase
VKRPFRPTPRRPANSACNRIDQSDDDDGDDDDDEKQEDGVKKRKKRRGAMPDRYLLYSAAVQSVDADLAFFQRIHRKKNGRPFELLREDFCGTALLASEWVRRARSHRAWGVDLDRATLAWSRKHYGPRLGPAADRLQLVRADVSSVRTPKVQVIAALNFSYWVFKKRESLRHYFRQAWKSLRPGGIFFLDALGGTEAMSENSEKRIVPASKGFEGSRLPAFTYVWEQAVFNPIDHAFVCHIHFKLRDGRQIKRAFTYDWRLWTLPELQELLSEAGFESVEMHFEGWDDKLDEPDGHFRRRSYFENQAGWVAYVVGFKGGRKKEGPRKAARP